MSISYTTNDGWTISVFDAPAYVDFGVRITDPNGEERFYSPCALSSDSYSVHWTHPENEDIALKEGIPWTPQEWLEYLRSDAYEILEGYVGAANV